MLEREVLLEFMRIGNAVKVTAVDPVTLTEVSIQGPATSTEAALTRAAVAKLAYVLRRRAE
ncbi:MAG: hypothetical protein V3R98_10615 [Alphaproteobacteria bacterium]